MSKKSCSNLICGLIAFTILNAELRAEFLSLSYYGSPTPPPEELGNGITGNFVKLVVPAGSSVDLLRFSSDGAGTDVFYLVNSNGLTPVSRSQAIGKNILNGPVTLNFAVSADPQPKGLLYSLVPAQPFRSVIVPQGTTNSFSVPAGQKITILGIMGKFSAGPYQPAVGSYIMINGSDFLFNSGDDLPISIAGPITITLGVPETGQGGGVFVYSLSSDFVDMAPSGYIQNTVGSLELVIENSSDLINWSPLIVKEINSQTSGREFYRIRVSQ
jgi:hypothetical protein